MPAIHPIQSRRHCGFTLVEVLVALLVLSIGLLGVGKLVLFSARSNGSAYLRSQATALGYQMLDYMRANRQAATNGSYTIAPAWVSTAATVPGTICTQGTTCPDTVLAQYDLYSWQQDLQAALGPTGDGQISTATFTDPVTLAPYVTATVTVKWDDTVAQQTFGAAAGTVTVTLETIL